jgi:hypothetical protein
LLDTKSVSFSISPGQTYNASVSHTAVAGTIDRRDVGLQIIVNSQVVAEDEWDDVFYVTAAGGVAILSASYSNGVCSYSFSGFQPNATVTLTVTQTGGYLTKTANSSGAGSGSFSDNDSAGTYTLRAADSYGNSATATFTISGGAGGAATLTASYSNGVCSYSFSGFQPNATVTLTVTQTGGYITATANSSGSGSGSFNDNDAAGTYTLQAADSYGHSATATFTIGGTAGGTIGFQVSIWGVPDFGIYQQWWAYYWDPGIGDFVSCGKWYSSSSKIAFSNVKPGGYFAVFLMKDSTVSSQYTSPTFQAVNGGSYTYDVQMDAIYG